MARVNPNKNLRIPKQFLKDKETRVFVEQLQFIIFQLWERTGGGTDLIEETIINNTTNVSSISSSSASMFRLSGRVEDLENNDMTSRFNQTTARLNQKIVEIEGFMNDILEELKNFHRPNRDIDVVIINATEKVLQQINLLNERVEEAFDTGINNLDVDEE